MRGIVVGRGSEGKGGKGRTVAKGGRKNVHEGREIDLYDLLYIPEGNLCNLKKQELKNPKSPSSPKKKKKPSPSSLWEFSPDPRPSERCSPMPPRS